MKSRRSFRKEDYRLDVGAYQFVVDRNDTPKKHFDTITKNLNAVLHKPEVRRRIKWATVIMLIINIIGWSLTSYFITKPQVTEAAPTQNARVVYSANSTTPQNRSYTAASNSFSGASAMQTGAAQTFMVNKASPVRNENIAGYVTTAGALYVQRWNGAAWSAEWGPITVGGNGVDGRRFDIAYEKTTGNAMVVYSNNTAGANELRYNYWNGTSWGGAQNLDSARLVYAPTAIKLISNPVGATNVIALTVEDIGTTTVNTSVLTSMIWSGSAWGNEPAAAHSAVMTNTITPLVQNDCFDQAYESSSGDLLVVYRSSATPFNYYRTYSGTTWGSATSISATARALAGNIVAISDPNSDRISIAYNTTSAVYGSSWSGSAIGAQATISTGTTGMTAAVNKKSVTGGYLVTGGVAYGVFFWQTTTAGAIGYNWDAGGTWGAAAASRNLGTASATVNWMDADTSSHSLDTMMLMMSTGAAGTSSLWAKRLVVSVGPNFSWTNSDAGTAISTTLASATSQNFDFRFNRYASPGTVMSAEIDYDNLQGGTAWNTASFATTETTGDVKLKVYYTVGTACDTIVPDGVLAGNSSGFDVAASPVTISGLTPTATTYNKICLQATLTYTAGTPLLNDWTVAWSKGASNTNPNSPTTLKQGTTSGGNEIAESAWTTDNTPYLGFTISDPDAGDTVKYQVQVADNLSFTAPTIDFTPTGTSANPTTFAFNVGTYTGGTCTGSCPATLPDLAAGYWWRVRAIDNNAAVSGWSEPGVAGTMDFKLDATAPTGLTVYDGNANGSQQASSTTALNALSASWTAASFTVSGPATPNKYQYAIGTTSGGTQTLNWVSVNTEGSVVTASGLNVATGVMYYWTVKATDLVGNVTTVTSPGQYVLPSLSFTLSTNSITFANLGNGNNWTDNKTVTYTTRTNGNGGYTVKNYILQLLTSIAYPADTIANWPSPYNAPTTWAGNCIANAQCGFGYTSSDATVAASGGNYAYYSLSSPGNVVADNVGPTIDGSRNLVDENFIITNKVSVLANQTAGTYQTTMQVIVTSNY